MKFSLDYIFAKNGKGRCVQHLTIYICGLKFSPTEASGENGENFIGAKNICCTVHYFVEVEAKLSYKIGLLPTNFTVKGLACQ